MAEVFSPTLLHLLVATALGFIVGLELKAYRTTVQSSPTLWEFGTTRTYTFVAMLGEIAYLLDTRYLSVYLILFVMLSLLFGIYYLKTLTKDKAGILPYVMLVSVYTFGPLAERFGVWMSALVFVLCVFVLSVSRRLRGIENRLAVGEFETLAKMILLSAVILPLLPDTPLPTPYLPISPFKLWLAVVVISAISYGGYLLQKYLFPNKGYFVTGLIGGTYSSTATTVVMSRKIRTSPLRSTLTASIIAATAMMYLRVIVVAAVFNRTIAVELVGYLGALSLSGFVIALFFLRREQRNEPAPFVDKNPLELGAAFTFAALFALMMAATRFVMQHYGQSGLEALAFVVGFADIDPFILSLLTGKYDITVHQIVSAVFIATGSNNVLKSIYALWFGGLRHNWPAACVLALLGIVTIALAFV